MSYIGGFCLTSLSHFPQIRGKCDSGCVFGLGTVLLRHNGVAFHDPCKVRILPAVDVHELPAFLGLGHEVADLIYVAVCLFTRRVTDRKPNKEAYGDTHHKTCGDDYVHHLIRDIHGKSEYDGGEKEQ